MFAPVSVLGFGKRAVIWVQGCSNNCPNCIAENAKDRNGGKLIETDKLLEWVLCQRGIEGVTISGGEPFDQPIGLQDLTAKLKRESLGVICYTGYYYEDLLLDPQKRLVLSNIDLLIDGPYIEDEHGDLLWRASKNQRLIFLTGRYNASELVDRSVGLEFFLDENNKLFYAGVPSIPHFDEVFNKILTSYDLTILEED